jgi:hypothetical protein
MCARTPPPSPAAQPPTPAHPPGPPPRALVGAGRVAGRSLMVHLTVDRTGRIGAPVSWRQGVQMVSTAGQLARFLNKNQAEGGRFEPAQRHGRVTRASALESLCRKVLRPSQASTPAPQNDPKRPGITRENRDRSRFFAAPSSTEPSRTARDYRRRPHPCPRLAARCRPTAAPRSAPMHAPTTGARGAAR